LRDLHHENVISLKECYEGDTSYYMIIDLMSGNTLSHYFNKHYSRKPVIHDEAKIIMKVINKYE